MIHEGERYPTKVDAFHAFLRCDDDHDFEVFLRNALITEEGRAFYDQLSRFLRRYI